MNIENKTNGANISLSIDIKVKAIPRTKEEYLKDLEAREEVANASKNKNS